MTEDDAARIAEMDSDIAEMDADIAALYDVLNGRAQASPQLLTRLVARLTVERSALARQRERLALRGGDVPDAERPQ